jgi:hypothetical protein
MNFPFPPNFVTLLLPLPHHRLRRLHLRLRQVHLRRLHGRLREPGWVTAHERAGAGIPNGLVFKGSAVMAVGATDARTSAAPETGTPPSCSTGRGWVMQPMPSCRKGGRHGMPARTCKHLHLGALSLAYE